MSFFFLFLFYRKRRYKAKVKDSRDRSHSATTESRRSENNATAANVTGKFSSILQGFNQGFVNRMVRNQINILRKSYTVL